jgi:glutathione peroxidase
MSAYDYAFVSIDGGDLPLSQWRGRPVLVVNTASFCGYTPQYKGLEALWRSHRDRGLVVLGVPSNDFGEQEPGSEAEIKSFCATYDVSFPLTRKVKVTGADAHPFYRWLAGALGERGVPRWNFYKFLIDGGGQAAGAWPSSTAPQAKDITGAIDAALGSRP